jgi:hypothetical protein
VIPLYGFLEGDTIGLLLLANEDDTIEELARQLSASASVRVRPKARYDVIHHGQVLAPSATARESGLAPLDRIDVVDGSRVS